MQEPKLLIEFTVEGPPVSAQSHNRRNLERWRAKVADAARSAWAGAGLYDGDVDLTVTYYSERRWRADGDNIAKPIQDALQDVIYRDDRQVKDVAFKMRDLNGRFSVRFMSPMLAAAFVRGEEFLHIRVERSPAIEELG